MFCLSAQPTLVSSQNYELSFRQAGSASNEKLLENLVVLMQKSKNFTKKSFKLTYANHFKCLHDLKVDFH